MTIHLTQAEVAERLQVSPRTLEGWRFTGRVNLPYLKFSGGAVRYRLQDVEAFEERHLQSPISQLAPYAGHPKLGGRL
jgi:predicted site-specific integrase-resolvase